MKARSHLILWWYEVRLLISLLLFRLFKPFLNTFFSEYELDDNTLMSIMEWRMEIPLLSPQSRGPQFSERLILSAIVLLSETCRLSLPPASPESVTSQPTPVTAHF